MNLRFLKWFVQSFFHIFSVFFVVGDFNSLDNHKDDEKRNFVSCIHL